MNTGYLAVFMVTSWIFAYVIIRRRDTLPEGARRKLAITALVLVSASFLLFLLSLFFME